MAGLYEQLFEKALVAVKQHNHEKALSLLVESIKLKPDFADAWVVRGTIRLADEEYLDAVLHFDRALELNQNAHDAWNNRGLAFSHLALWQSAEQSFRRSYDLMPCIDPCMNLANMYCARLMLPQAEAAYRKALTHEPDNLDANINLGITLLGQRKWREGWPHYEARHVNSPYQMRSRRLHPNWTGESLEGKRILLYPEQGLGDEIAFMRFATWVKKAGAAHVVLEAMPPLLRLAGTVAGVDEVAIKNETPKGAVDYSCAIMDVPMVLDIGPDEITVPSYLKAPSVPIAPLPPGINVGLCWQTGQRPLQPEARVTAANKSVPLLWMKPMAQLGINLISLQLNNPDPLLSKEMGLIDYMADMTDLADTAALINQLDLVISADTAVAHLAGAMGKPVWNMVRYGGYWPWMDAWDTTEWYPSMRLYRQHRLGDWPTLLERVFSDLGEFIRTKKARAA
jgi:Tfp pilus assembly protein PilF